MQRVSSFLPSWEKRQSHAKAGSRSGRSWWSNRSSTSAGGLGKIDVNGTSSGSPGPSASGKVQREAYWPAPLDIECDKAARILKSFCNDGFLAPLDDVADPPPLSSSVTSDPKTPTKVTKKIPQRVIENAAGIAIFSCMRSGLWLTGSGGSGILIARKSDGTWSPPSGIMLHTPSLSFIIGVDVYDCVLVVNNLAALETISRPRVTLGEEVLLAGGPLVVLNSTDAPAKRDDLGNTVFTYMKARGVHRDVNLFGSILTERSNENERFYTPDVTQMAILAGNVSRHVEEMRPLFEVIKMAEGRTDYDQQVIAKLALEQSPSDATITTPQSITASANNNFGIPSINDPDPFGVLALEMAGLEIREAGSKIRPTSSQFGINSNPTSPSFSRFHRQSMDTYNTRSNRGSHVSAHSQLTDVGTQTEAGDKTPDTSPSSAETGSNLERATLNSQAIPEAQEDEVTEETKEEEVAEQEEEEDASYASIDAAALEHISPRQSFSKDRGIDDVLASTQAEVDRLTPHLAPEFDKASKASSHYERSDDGIDEQDEAIALNNADDQVEIKDVDLDEESGSQAEDDLQSDEEDENSDDFNDADDEDDEEPVIFEVAQVQPAQTQAVASRVIQAKGSMVTIPARLPPPLPARSPMRISRASKSEIGDVSHLRNLSNQTSSAGHLTPEPLAVSRSASPSEDLTSGSKPHSIAEASDDDDGESFDTKEDVRASREVQEGLAEEVQEGPAEEVQEAEVFQDDPVEGVQDGLSEEVQDGPVEKIRDGTVEVVQDGPVEDHHNAEAGEHDTKSNNPKFEVSEPVKSGSSTDESKGDASSIKSNDQDHTDNSESGSPQKHTSSVCTGLTEDRWSIDESSVQTPTSDRRLSVEMAGDETPTKTLRERPHPDTKESRPLSEVAEEAPASKDTAEAS